MFLLLNLTDCSSGPEIPVEITVDGAQIVLRYTTVQDLINLLYKAGSNSINLFGMNFDKATEWEDKENAKLHIQMSRSDCEKIQKSE